MVGAIILICCYWKITIQHKEKNWDNLNEVTNNFKGFDSSFCDVEYISYQNGQHISILAKNGVSLGKNLLLKNPKAKFTSINHQKKDIHIQALHAKYDQKDLFLTGNVKIQSDNGLKILTPKSHYTVSDSVAVGTEGAKAFYKNLVLITPSYRADLKNKIVRAIGKGTHLHLYPTDS